MVMVTPLVLLLILARNNRRKLRIISKPIFIQNSRQKDFCHQDLLRSQRMHGAPRPEIAGISSQPRSAYSTPIKRMAHIQADKLQRPAPKSGMGKKQGPQGTTTKTGKPTPKPTIAVGRQHGVRKNHRHAIAFQQNLADTRGLRAPAQPRCLIGQWLS
jgi:hypothetical protein